MTATTAIGRGANAQNEHGQAEDYKEQLNVLAVDLGAGGKQESKLVFHD